MSIVKLLNAQKHMEQKQFLVQWQHGKEKEATQEASKEMYAHFPKYFLKDNETTSVGFVFQ